MEPITKDAKGTFTDEEGRVIGHFDGKIFDDGTFIDGYGVGGYEPPEATNEAKDPVVLFVGSDEPAIVRQARIRRGLISFKAWRLEKSDPASE